MLTTALSILLFNGEAAPAKPAPAFLPTLSNFGSSGSGQKAALTWTLAPTAKVAYVIVQRRSSTQSSWEAMANRPVTAATRYRFQNTGLRAGTYRLVTVDYDGTPAFSRSLTVR
ncbi:hypothetical protein [Hymenobacter saemangeumensis]|uniref:hypothetical protein n=1 Tax=Hymenobacter saemangeumensis TaxID=1084522 RepID=UPI0031EC367F